MICIDCGKKDMYYDDKAGFNDNGFEHGVIYCFDYHLKGNLCGQCKSQKRCETKQKN